MTNSVRSFFGSNPHRRGNFFAVDKEHWTKVSDLAIRQNDAGLQVAYLILAAFTGRDNLHTKASVNAIEKRTSLSRAEARVAIETLEHHNLIANRKTKELPLYMLGPKDLDPNANAHWLPNALVEVPEGQASPVDRILKNSNAGLMDLLVRLYAYIDHEKDGYIPKGVICRTYSQLSIGKTEHAELLAFVPETLDFELREPFGRISSEATVEKYIDLLSKLDLIDWKVWLYSEGLEIGSHQEASDQVCLLCPLEQAGDVLKSVQEVEGLGIPEGGFHVAVPIDNPKLQAKGLMRLRYLPETAPVVEMRNKAGRQGISRAA